MRRPFEEGLLDGLTGTGISPVQASRLLTMLDAERRHDLLVLRGRRAAFQVATGGGFDGRLWTYLTDIPQSAFELDAGAVAELTRIAQSCRYLLCQTEELRCFLEAAVPAACGKCELLRPVVPPLELKEPRVPGRAGFLRLVYTGKFAPRWNTYEMTQLPRMLAARGVRAQIHMVGDKIHDDPADPGYSRRMRRVLGSAAADMAAPVAANGVAWHGGRPRQEAMRIAAACDIGLGWRHPTLDASLELSTKILEFGSLGLPVVLNRTPMHEALLGVDYPLFAASQEDVIEVVATCAADPEVAKLAASRAAAAADGFSLERAVGCLGGLLRRTFPAGGTVSSAGTAPDSSAGTAPVSSAGTPPDSSAGTAPKLLKVAVAGHDLKFFTPILEYLRNIPGLDVRLDHWPALAEHDAAQSGALARWADVVICEWCGPNAVWYSRHKRRGSRLLVRLHRFELYSRYVREVDIAAIDQLVCVSPHYARLASERAAGPPARS